MRRNRAAAVSATALLTASLVLGSASPAHAVPTGCTTWQEGYVVYSQCTGGTGTQAAWASGVHVNPMVGWIEMSGPRVGVGEISSVNFRGTVWYRGTTLYD
ncbi:hypothetical protein Skr01_51610 [Sphaerisporangium krabiense]|uniref:Uncharacterized protein n=1 Tax=Sphaerisporangium krabiense TaxID=763782 RepID=A0A7W9DT06_9ACTN|nr:hypothetical protein [Sphaerisporangium krabiense]MBB5630126.1 hypothetical protein [Sphaerisporangium krabiense]GII65076.1 hypothetical protein Skr01_51610 [Sphaerisporangium krabiense]